MSLDLYGKYFWTRRKGDDVALSTGERLQFMDADSSRFRLGGRLAYKASDRVSPYVGAAFAKEFDGKARAKSDGVDLDAPSIKGNTGLGEIGLTFRPSVEWPLYFD
ncbi:MAG: autotransporter domain-containing protein [Deltaproteobacteria bacterium]|nr:autotransporter domain-containing protein [Deltaproteobacteria bacterium]